MLLLFSHCHSNLITQYYLYCGDQKFVDLGLGSHRVKCPVHNDFRQVWRQFVFHLGYRRNPFYSKLQDQLQYAKKLILLLILRSIHFSALPSVSLLYVQEGEFWEVNPVCSLALAVCLCVFLIHVFLQ